MWGARSTADASDGPLGDADRPSGGGNPPLLITALIRARSHCDNSNKERWQRKFLCLPVFFYACVLFFCFFVFWSSVRDEFHNPRLDLWWKNVSINQGLRGQGHTGPCTAEHPESVCGSGDGQNMLRRLRVHKVADRSFARQCLIAQSNLWFFSPFFYSKTISAAGKKRSEKEWCFEDIIKDIVQRTTFCIFELLLSLKTTQNMEIWLPEAHKSMISKASEPNKYGELNTLKCKSHLKICIWVNLKEVCLLKTLRGRNGWSWRGIEGGGREGVCVCDTHRQAAAEFFFFFFSRCHWSSCWIALNDSSWSGLTDTAASLLWIPESALSDLNN